MMHGYAHLMRDFLAEWNGEEGRLDTWRNRLARLSADDPVTVDDWIGDIFSRSNPAWQRAGVLQETKTGRTAVSNTRQTREQCGRILRERISAVTD